MLASSCSKYKYETVSGDPLKTRIYTLPNGLKVYMSVMKEQPRIQTAIAVRVGGKNDPAETTGLAHYFEHLMFKGTEKFGTSDYAAEKPMLDEIERLFEVYRKTTDEAERAAIYHRIASGGQVPPEDEQRLMEYNHELYMAAKTAAMLQEGDGEKYDSLFEDEEEKNGEEKTASEIAGEAEISVPGGGGDAGLDIASE